MTLILLLSSWFMFLQTKTVTLTVQTLTWERHIPIQERTIKNGEGWTLPSQTLTHQGVKRYKETVQVISHYVPDTQTVTDTITKRGDPYVCGTIDLGNGYFKDDICYETIYDTVEREEPYDRPIYKDQDVYATWYTYTYETWPTINTANTSGNHTTKPYWANPTLKFQQREGKRQERYTAILSLDTKTYMHNLSQTQWEKLQPGIEIQAE